MTTAHAVIDVRDAGAPDVRLRATAPQRWTLQRRASDGWADLVHEVGGGGVFGGDVNRTTIRAGAGTRLVVRGISATPARGNRRAITATRLVAEAGSTILYLPSALIPQTGADHTASVRIDVGRGARVLAASVVVPGRSAMGERGAFARLRMRTVAMLDGELAFAEDATLTPASAPIDAPSAFAGDDAALSVVAIGDWAPSTLTWWSEIDVPQCVRGSAARLRGGGVGYRALSRSLGDAIAMLDVIEGAIRRAE